MTDNNQTIVVIPSEDKKVEPKHSDDLMKFEWNKVGDNFKILTLYSNSIGSRVSSNTKGTILLPISH